MRGAALLGGVLLAGCAAAPQAPEDAPATWEGTAEPWAAEAIYFVLTDRFVDGDPGNNQPAQGGPERGTFDRPVSHPEGGSGNIGYLGGDFRGILANAAYIRDMGFTAVWVSPVVDNPDEAFSGGDTLAQSPFADNGKTGYHGYWGVDFFREDEHWVSPGLDFAGFTAAMRGAGLKTVLDIVTNHGSPSFTMPADQPRYGELYDDGVLVADHMNLHPSALSDDEPLHAFFHHEPDITQLSNLDEGNPAVLDYFVRAYGQWIDRGADAFRIDTIKHMPHTWWAAFTAAIRAEHPGFFMFAESFSFDAAFIAEHTWAENGGVSVLDFPGRAAMLAVFADGAPMARLQDHLHLDDGLYANPYELMTFHDNHDMPRLHADVDGFIDAHNWLFTSRGIPVIYYGSETAFRAGTAEHRGNRDYFGQARIDAAAGHPVHAALTRIANLRKASTALQRGLQLDIAYDDDTAVFLRAWAKDGAVDNALVFLNRGAAAVALPVPARLRGLRWIDGFSGAAVDGPLVQVPAHGVVVLRSSDAIGDAVLQARLGVLQAQARRG